MSASAPAGIAAMRKLLGQNTASGRRRIEQVFNDFCEISALSLRNVVDDTGHDQREARYLEILGEYTPEETDRFVQTLAQLAIALEDRMQDVLGHLYMDLEIGNAATGQFFTPYEVSLLSARMSMSNARATVAERGYLTLNEPSCGSGGMVIAAAQVMREEGLNPQQHLHVIAQDIDIVAVHMAYVQLSLLGIPALVVHGDTLTLETHDVWPTVFHVMSGWDLIFNRHTPIARTQETAS